MCFTNVYFKGIFFNLIFATKICKKLKKFFIKKKINSLEWLQNLKQHSTPIGAFCGEKFYYES